MINTSESKETTKQLPSSSKKTKLSSEPSHQQSNNNNNKLSSHHPPVETFVDASKLKPQNHQTRANIVDKLIKKFDERSKTPNPPQVVYQIERVVDNNLENINSQQQLERRPSSVSATQVANKFEKKNHPKSKPTTPTPMQYKDVTSLYGTPIAVMRPSRDQQILTNNNAKATKNLQPEHHKSTNDLKAIIYPNGVKIMKFSENNNSSLERRPTTSVSSSSKQVVSILKKPKPTPNEAGNLLIFKRPPSSSNEVTQTHANNNTAPQSVSNIAQKDMKKSHESSSSSSDSSTEDSNPRAEPKAELALNSEIEACLIGSSMISPLNIRNLFPTRKCMFKCILGGFTEDCFYYIKRKTDLLKSCKCFVIVCASNDCDSSNDMQTVITDYLDFALYLHKNFPKAKLVFCKLVPRLLTACVSLDEWEKRRTCFNDFVENTLVNIIANSVCVTQSKFEDKDLLPELLCDGVHFSSKAIPIYEKKLKKVIDQVLV
jgi:hypothetical protein